MWHLELPRFEAFVFDWDGTAVATRTTDAAAVRSVVEALCATAAPVYVVSGTNAAVVDGQLGARPASRGHLHLCVNRGSERFDVDGEGIRLRFRRVASRSERDALDRTATAVVGELDRIGVRTTVLPSRLNRSKIDLLPEWHVKSPLKTAVREVLQAVSEKFRMLGGQPIAAVVAMAEDYASAAGLPRVHVTSDVKHVEIGLTSKGDAAGWIFDDLWRREIGPRKVLVIGDEFGPVGGCPGNDNSLLIAAAREATFVSVGIEPAGVPPRVGHVGGGPQRCLAILQEQAGLRSSQGAPNRRAPALQVERS